MKKIKKASDPYGGTYPYRKYIEQNIEEIEKVAYNKVQRLQEILSDIDLYEYAIKEANI